MPSEKIVAFCRSKGWWHDDPAPGYRDALLALGIEPRSDFGQFYLHAEDGPTFYARGRELYQICWFFLHAGYAANMERMRAALRMAETYLPLDGFEGESGFFYDKVNGSVLALGLGDDLRNFHAGKATPRWADFNAFIEWFFELEA